MKREVGYVDNSGVYLAYQVCGSGDRDIVFLPSWSYSHIDVIWDHPAPAHFLTRLANIGRLIHIDRRGVGASDRTALGPFEEHVGDLVVVLDALGSERPTLFGLGEGAFIAALFARRIRVASAAWS